MSGVVSVLERLPLPVVLTLAVLLVLGETAVIVGLCFPVEVTLLFVGFLAYLGEVPLAVAFLLTIGAAMAGDALALRSGRKHGPRVRASRVGVRIGAARWQRADRILHRLGGRSAFVARWVPFVRTLLPRLAGSAGLPYRRFVGWNAAGAVTAVGSSVALGYLAGASYQRVADLLGRLTTAGLLLAAVVAGVVVAGRWLGRHPDPARAVAARLAATAPVRRLGRRAGGGAGRAGRGWVMAASLVAGLVLLFGFGSALSWVVQATVEHSGLWRLDAAVAGWLAERRSDPAARVAAVLNTGVRASVPVVLVAVVAVGHALLRRLRPAGDLLGLVGSAGAFLPLVLLAVAMDLTGAGPVVTPLAVATAALCTLAWLSTRGRRWPGAVTGWGAAAVGVVGLAAAGLYPGWHTASGTVTAVLLGLLWTAVFVIAWATRAGPAPVPDPVPAPVPVDSGAAGPMPGVSPAA